MALKRSETQYGRARDSAVWDHGATSIWFILARCDASAAVVWNQHGCTAWAQRSLGNMRAHCARMTQEMKRRR